VRRWRIDPTNGAYVIALDSLDSPHPATAGLGCGKRCRLHVVFTLQPIVPRPARRHAANPLRARGYARVRMRNKATPTVPRPESAHARTHVRARPL
jgi:hypothetical protein